MATSLRIVHVTNTLFLPHAFGGVQNAVLGLADALVRRGHDITILTSDLAARTGGRATSSQLSNGVSVVRVPHVSTRLATRTAIVHTPMFRSVLEEHAEACDLIHVHDIWAPQNVAVRSVAHKYGVPYVVQARGSLPIAGRLRALKLLYREVWGRKVLRSARRVLALTDLEYEQYRSLGVASDRIARVHNGIDATPYRVLPQRGAFRYLLGIPDDSKLVLYLGRLNAIKGIDILVKAFAHVSAEVPSLHLAIVGPDDGFGRFVQSIVAKLGIHGHVHFVDQLDGTDKIQAYVDADVFVLPSRYDTYPHTVLEAMACGTPVVVTDKCGIAPLVMNHWAGVVTPADNDGLATGIMRVLTGSKRCAPRETERRFDFLDTYDLDTVVKEYERVYHECLWPDNKSADLF